MRRILGGVDSVSRWSGKAVSMLVLAVIGLLLMEITLRYVFNSPTLWAHETSQFMFAIYSVLGGAYVLLHYQHVKVDVIYTRFSPRGRAILDSVTYLLFFLFIVLMLVHGWHMAWLAVKVKETSLPPFPAPTWVIKLAIPIGAFMIFLQGLAHFIRSLSMAITRKELA